MTHLLQNSPSLPRGGNGHQEQPGGGALALVVLRAGHGRGQPTSGVIAVLIPFSSCQTDVGIMIHPAGQVAGLLAPVVTKTSRAWCQRSPSRCHPGQRQSSRSQALPLVFLWSSCRMVTCGAFEVTTETTLTLLSLGTSPRMSSAASVLFEAAHPVLSGCCRSTGCLPATPVSLQHRPGDQPLSCRGSASAGLTGRCPGAEEACLLLLADAEPEHGLWPGSRLLRCFRRLGYFSAQLCHHLLN